ncbi:hypothetical protein HXX76_012964 [Chlamydomonas incerta]|uniref:Uncharacterized protein n=1 Tax=Chlamydomonas incerta TaxID=51695 RepID=A0A835SG80_CHLIN|nr:hypothetical protein HXX76_012964 [Chlamydomonas incerta]|eukprot:KAG2426652.1 hypothetical protein HXX76_012964 [Chlamydomonas incerta]
MHLSATVFNKSCDNEAACNVTIVKGQKIGSVGVSVAEFPHVHFEIRDPPSYDNCSANWQADAVNPFRILPYNRSDAAHATRLNITAVAGTGIGSDAPRVMLFINTTRYDWNKVLLVMRDGAGAVVGTYQTPNETSYASYNAKPNWYDIELWNRQWTHRDSSAASWSSFGCGGGNACPYCDQHGAAYDPNTHLDAQCPDSPSACCFNGVRMEPYIFNNRTTGLSYNVTFNLTKNSTDAAACVEAYLLAKSPLTGEYDGSIIGAASWGLCVDTVTPDGEEEAKLAARRRLLMAAGGSGGSSSVRGGASTVGGGRQGVLAGAVAAGAGGMARGGRNQQRRLQAVGAGEVLSRARRALRSTQQP